VRALLHGGCVAGADGVASVWFIPTRVSQSDLRTCSSGKQKSDIRTSKKRELELEIRLSAFEPPYHLTVRLSDL